MQDEFIRGRSFTYVKERPLLAKLLNYIMPPILGTELA